MERGGGLGHVVMAWELGAGFGHVAKLHVLTLAFVARGWRVTLVLRVMDVARHFVWPKGVQMWQAPVWHPGSDHGAAESTLAGPMQRVPSINMSSLLLDSGWHDGFVVAAQAQTWRTLLDSLRPTLLLADYAPVAMWVARSRSVPVVNVGVSISVPLQAEPMPALMWWRGAQLEQRRMHDHRLMAVAEFAVEKLRLTSWNRAADAWRADLEVLCTLPALEFGAIQGQPRDCCGLLEQPAVGDLPAWPTGAGPRVFAYFSARANAFEPLMRALQRSGACVLVVAPDALESQQTRWNSAQIRVSRCPLDLDATLRDAQLVVTQGNHGTTAQALRHGVPVLAVPDQLERTCNGMGVQKSGAGRLVLDRAGAASPEFESVLDELLTQSRYQLAASVIAGQPLTRLSAPAVAEQVADACNGWRVSA